jgi:cellulose synthase/poly-beta-1,6-N-acetylglucosamine synthase-like glycosyltransferase
MPSRSELDAALDNMASSALGEPAAPVARDIGRRFRRLHPRTERAGRRALTLLCLVPLSIILAVKGAHLVGDPVLNAYGIAVLVSTMALMYVAFVHYRDPAVDAMSTHLDTGDDRSAEWPAVSVLVAVHDEIGVIEACLDSLLDIDYPDLEVIVVDDASTDGTAELLQRLSEQRPFRFIRLQKNVGKKRALTTGVRRSRGEILVFTDSDCIVAPDAVSRLVTVFQSDPDVGALSGHARASNADVNLLTRVQDVWYDGQFGVAKAAEAVLGSVTCVSGPLAAFRREVIVSYLPAWANDRFAGREFRFATDRQLTAYVLCEPWVGEDLKERYASDPLVERSRDVRRWKVGYVRSARVTTVVPSTARAFLRQQVRWKKSFIRNLFFTGRYYWRRGLRVAGFYYGHALWVLVAPVMVFRHMVWLPLHGAAFVTLLYLCGVFLKGSMWAIAYRVQNPGDSRWVYRPMMSVLSALCLAWLLPYSALTIRRSIWAREATTPKAVRSDRWLLSGVSD